MFLHAVRVKVSPVRRVICHLMADKTNDDECRCEQHLLKDSTRRVVARVTGVVKFGAFVEQSRRMALSLTLFGAHQIDYGVVHGSASLSEAPRAL